jgi:hypothetical protein
MQTPKMERIDCALCRCRWKDGEQYQPVIIPRNDKGYRYHEHTIAHPECADAVLTADRELGLWVHWFEKYPSINPATPGD